MARKSFALVLLALGADAVRSSAFILVGVLGSDPPDSQNDVRKCVAEFYLRQGQPNAESLHHARELSDASVSDASVEAVKGSKPPRLSDLQDKVEKDGVAAAQDGQSKRLHSCSLWSGLQGMTSSYPLRKLTNAGLRQLHQVLHTRKA